jgi:hypothetical protein
VIHSITNHFVGLIAYVYCPLDAQLLVISLLSNTYNRLYYTKMFNDEIMMMYLVICIYYAIVNKPLVASFFLSMGMGVKAGLLLLIPGFLGSL